MIKCSLFTWSAFLRFLSQCQCLVVFSTANLTFLYTLFSKMVWIFEIIGSILPRTRSACATLMCLTFLSLQGVQSVWKILINAHPVLFRNYVVGIADVMMIYCRFYGVLLAVFRYGFITDQQFWFLYAPFIPREMIVQANPPVFTRNIFYLIGRIFTLYMHRYCYLPSSQFDYSCYLLL